MRIESLWNGDGGEVMGMADDRNADITGLTCDSREVKPGYLFAALPGLQSDGRDFIYDALDRGAVCVLAQSGTVLEKQHQDISLLIDDNPRRRFALMAARFFDVQPETIVAVTGTNGKTSVVSLVRQIWTNLGRSAASLGTLGISAPGRETVGSLTTPDPAGLHQDVHDLAVEGVSHLAVEASSHGLSQYRLDGVKIGAAAFTNLTRDHLDYHSSMDEYLTAKARLFSEVMVPGGTAVLNADAPEFATLTKICLTQGHKIFSYGLKQGDIRCDSIVATQTGFRLEINAQGARADVALPLIGNFQILNVLCAVGLVLAGGEDANAVLQTLSVLEGASGRLQRIKGHPTGAEIFIDYAHTPEALASVLRALRPHTKGKLSVVFGCGGDRDTGKRAEMGLVAHALADKIIITDDNPRSEDPSEIRHQILSACPQAQEIGGRAEAIATAAAELEADDLLIIAGKGHEENQIIGDKIIPFSDVDVTEAALKELGS